MAYVPMPDGQPQHFLRVDDVAETIHFLLKQGDNVKMGPEILIRTMRDPFNT